MSIKGANPANSSTADRSSSMAGCDPGQRIVVVGTCGCGKTYVARQLAERLSIPYICNDAIVWGPKWTPTPKPQRYQLFDAATQADAWTYDGNVGSLTDAEDRLILQRADTLVWLDLPRWTVHRQILWRTIRRVCSRQSLWHDNRETMRALISRESIVWMSIKSYNHHRRNYAAVLADPTYAHLRKLRFTSRRELNRWLNQITGSRPAAPRDEQ